MVSLNCAKNTLTKTYIIEIFLQKTNSCGSSSPLSSEKAQMETTPDKHTQLWELQPINNPEFRTTINGSKSAK